MSWKYIKKDHQVHLEEYKYKIKKKKMVKLIDVELEPDDSNDSVDSNDSHDPDDSKQLH